MPQMAPMNWLTLFMFFVITFFFLNTMNYFCFYYPMKKPNLVKIKTPTNWKW